MRAGVGVIIILINTVGLYSRVVVCTVVYNVQYVQGVRVRKGSSLRSQLGAVSLSLVNYFRIVLKIDTSVVT